jgi:hypothetical protein
LARLGLGLAFCFFGVWIGLDWYFAFHFGVIGSDGFLSWIGLVFCVSSSSELVHWGKQTGVTTNKQRSKGGNACNAYENGYGAFWRWGLGGTFFLGT